MSAKDLLKRFAKLSELPCLEVFDGVIFPVETGVIEVERADNINAVQHAEINQLHDKYIVCVGRYQNGSWHEYGVVVRIISILVFNDSRIKLMLQPVFRVKTNLPYRSEDNNCWLSMVALDNTDIIPDKRLKLLLKKSWGLYVALGKGKVSGADDKFDKLKGLEEIAFRMAGHLLSLSNEERERLVNTDGTESLIRQVIFFIEREKEYYLVEEQLSESVRQEMDKDNREYVRDKKLKILQRELGSNVSQDVRELAQKIDLLPLSEENKKKVASEIKKLENTHQSSPEYSLSTHYLTWVLDMPWGKIKDTEPSIKMAKKILDRDHYGLEKTKERILEALAVQIRTNSVSGSILCFIGPPGVGKTSVGQSIAEAAGRSYVRIALGGVKDEAEIRGHRKTYVGAMPGKIVKALKTAENMNPCILLDEIDKISADLRGDPSSALLEVLDPEQNHRFNDHFVDLDIDLSKVLFIATANSYDIPAPLLDRMEVIDLSGYTESEKMAIAQKYLIPKSMRKHGLVANELKIKKQALQSMIRLYTREAGVRELERMLDKISRKRVRELLEQQQFEVRVGRPELKNYLGVELYDEDSRLKKSMVGIAQGLAWTNCGGVMLNIEAALLSGRGKLTHTGSLGEVMQESVQAALTVTRSIGADYNMDDEYFENIDLHVHLPEGATPKDGPSAGITLCTALVSLVTKNPVRLDVAMTGEINLRGEVMAIGGLKEKLLAALQARIEEVIIPKENARELDEIPQEVKDGLKIHVVSSIKQVLEIALTKKLTKQAWPKKKKKKDEEK